MQNNTKENLYTEENFQLLINSLNNIKKKTSIENNSENDTKQKIYDALNEIEKKSQIKPSYKNFINKIITKENIEKSENIIIKDLEEKNMPGYSPDLKILISKIVSDENIENTKNYFIKQFQALDI
ncbi:hypothetical protein fh0823_27920 (plasmid) [Francisella halioticida]|uniref:hypothetical protein n=1 Tax=Francisella halioticida TaxID=549298 RepID=UPI001AF9BAE9|nr:hypothetical protein [Francisella halioticida]BCD92655.1 hypothetical protein fh0823_27920 [Francisella halioticida]